MRVNKVCNPFPGVKVNRRPRLAAALAAALLPALTVAGCGSDVNKPKGTIGYVRGFAGLIAGDEPRSVTIARDVLTAGGTAADAAVALYFTMAVTLPSSAGLGGGGACLVFKDEGKGKSTTEVLDFRPHSAAIPGNPRGMYALHAKYGVLRWEQLLNSAEQMARFGVPVSRVFATDLAKAAPAIAQDAEARKLFMPGGRPLNEGEQMIQADLATTLSKLRQRGPGELYAGPLANEYVQAVLATGVRIGIDELRSYTPVWSKGVTQPQGFDTVHFVEGSGLAPNWAGGQAPSDAPDAATGFAIGDSFGNAVACTIAMPVAFGQGRFMPGWGLAAAPVGILPPRGVEPLMVVNHNSHEVRLALAASHPAALMAAARRFLVEAQPLDKAVAVSQGHVNGLHCGGGQVSAARCTAAVDPNGYGLSMIVGK
ncbi:MAG: gamma-glutamyltransferase family protein [Rhodospirillales bacterium]|nr:gamma-glutamyltransferase family protein [Rhodospirillales bacterium]